MMDFLTVLRSTTHPQRKSFRFEAGFWQASQSYFAIWYQTEQISVADFNELGAAIKKLASDKTAAVITGSPKVTEKYVRRSKDYFEPFAHRWIMLDIDSVDDPKGRDPATLTAVEVAGGAVSYLPEEFKRAKFWYHLSSSMGIKPGIRVHLWYWLDRPVTDQEKKAWLSDYPVDKALFNAVQPHFTADPEFIGGVDPYPDRFGLYEPVDATDTVFVPLDLAERTVIQDQKPRHVRASGVIERQEIIRDADTALAIDGREQLLFDLSNEVMFDLCKGRNDVPSVEEITDSLWEKFQAETDLDHVNERIWTRADAKDKAQSRHHEATSGRYSFRSRSDKITLLPAPKPDYACETVSPRDAKEKLDNALMGYFCSLKEGYSPRLALRLTMGLGKTTQTVAKLKDFLSGEVGKLVEVYVPRHDLMNEWEEALSGIKAGVIHVYPRTGGGIDSNGKRQYRPLCERADYVRELEKNGVSVYRNACLGTGEGERCIHFGSCEYLKQFQSPPHDLVTKGNVVRLYTHASLGLPRNEFEEERQPDLVVIDEGFLSSLVDDFPKVLAQDVRRHIKNDRYKRLGSMIVDSLADPESPGLFEELKEAGVNLRDLKEIDLSFLAPGISFEDERGTPAAVASAETYNALRSLLRVLSEEFHKAWQKSPARLWYDKDEGKVIICEQKELRVNAKCPVLLLDATADPILLDRLLPFTEYKKIDVHQNAIVTQVYDRTGSNIWWDENTDRVQELVEVLKAWVASGEKPLIISHKRMADTLRKEKLEGVNIGHFGGIRGSNEYKDCTVVFITGRNSPPPAFVEQQARAIFWEAEPPLAFENTADYLPLSLEGYWLSDRSVQGQSGVMVNSFRDKRISAVHRQIREAETIQAVARLRLVWSPHAKYVFLLGNLPVELPVDRLRTFNDMFPDALELELLKTRDLPLTAGSLLKLRPDLCESYDAARMKLERSSVRDVWSLDFLPGNMRLLAQKATYEAGEDRLRKHSHIFLPKTVGLTQGEEDFQYSFSTSRAADYSEVLSLLEKAWGAGNVHDLKLELWPLPGGS